MPIGIDHIVIAVNDLDRTTAGYSAAGFTVTPGGEHKGGASANVLGGPVEVALETDGAIAIGSSPDGGEPLARTPVATRTARARPASMAILGRNRRSPARPPERRLSAPKANAPMARPLLTSSVVL